MGGTVQEQVEWLQAQLAVSQVSWPAAGGQAAGSSALGADALARVDAHASFADISTRTNLEVRKAPNDLSSVE